MHNLKHLTLPACVMMITIASNIFGQLSTFEGVYVSEEPPLVLALRLKGNTMEGYLTDGNVLEKLNCTWQNPTLQLHSTQNGFMGTGFAALDEAGNLWVTDEQFNVVYFLHSNESLEAIWKELESAHNGTTQSAPSGSQTKPANIGNYGNKKFLHLYTGNGYTEKWAYYLYDNGTFYFRSSSAYTSGGYYDFSAATAGNDGGTYTIEKRSGQEFLTLHWNTGNQTSLRISKTDQGYLLDNEKYYLVGLNEYD